MFRIYHKLILPLVLLVFCIAQIQAEEATAEQPEGQIEQTAVSTIETTFQNASADDYLISVLQYHGFEPVKQSLVSSTDTSFPQNIIVTIPASKSHDSAKNKTSRTTVVFAFTEQFAIECEQQLCSFIKSLQMANLPYEAVVLLSAGDESILEDSEASFHPGGTATFVDQLDVTDSVCAIVVEQNAPSANIKLILGGGGDVAPMWLVHSLRKSAVLHGVFPSSPSMFISFYHKNVFRENKRVSTFLSKEIPAAGIQCMGTENDFAILLDAALSLAQTRSDWWDHHYALIPTGKNGIWLNESFFTICYLIFAFISLFLLCFFSFAGKQKHIARSKDVIRMWYVTPLMIVLSSLVLLLCELPFTGQNTSPILLFGVKIIITFFVTFITFVSLIRFTYHISLNACSFNMLVIAVFNIFIFSTVDISLLFIFFFEYIIVLATNKLKRIPFLVISLALMLLPFIPCTAELLAFSSAESLLTLIRCGFIGNVFLALLLFPFQMQVFRIFISLDLFSKEKHVPIKTVLFRSSILISICIGIVVLFYSFFSWIIIKNNLALKSKQAFTLIEKKDSPDFSTSYEEQQFLDLSARHLYIKSHAPIIRYTVSVITPQTVPLYDCNYNYSLLGTHTAYFQLPDYPSDTVEIVYSSDPEYASTITVKAYIASENNTVYLETATIETKAGS